ncbi:MAG: pectic acid lyase [Verrucomicrobia bacterium]|nr:pectic acid lyase [Verrucomicrobiota bacterium]
MKTGIFRVAISLAVSSVASAAEPPLREQAVVAMKKAATFYRTKAAAHGGYVYYYSLDFTQRWGEGKATANQIIVQPPGTPAVGMAYLQAFAATGDKFYLDAARAAAEALVHGQLESGGWTQAVDFDPRGAKVAQYRNGKGRGKNNSTLDDGISQSALRFLMHADRALGFKHKAIHEASEVARKALLAAQHPNGGFPQVWTGAAPKYAAVKASFPTYDWRTVGRVKNYWDMPTLNDDLCTYVSRTLEDGWEIYKDERCRQALVKLGNFLLLAQLPEPQPGWAQQYDQQMRPIWARKFEPPAVAGRESQNAIETLLKIHRITGEVKYLEPIPRALAWLKRSRLPDGRLARYYELRSNKPLYMTSDYQLTFSDADVPQHYGWKTSARVESIEAAFQAARAGKFTVEPAAPASEEPVRRILRELDSQGRWVSTYAGGMLVGQPKFPAGMKFIASEVFNRNLAALADYVAAGAK